MEQKPVNNPEATKPIRIPELDGLRAVAILLVVSFHYINNQLTNSSGKVGSMLAKATGFGWIGVDLFFVLSGFLIGNIILQYRDSPNFLKTFYIRRVLRIIPNYFLLVTLFLIILAIPYFAGSSFLTGQNSIPGWSYYLMVHNFYMAHLADMGNRAMSITWSIGIEEQFYLVFPFLLLLIKKKYVPYLLSVLIVVAWVCKAMIDAQDPPGLFFHIRSYVLLPSRMDALCFGILVSWLVQTGYIKVIAEKYYRWLIAVLVIDVLLCGVLYAKFGDLGPVKQTLFSIIFSVWVIIALERKQSWFAMLMRIRVMRWVGSISYSLYLFHYIILGLFFYVFLGKSDVGIMNPADIFVTLLAFGSSLLFSWIVYRWLENPLVKLGKKWKY